MKTRRSIIGVWRRDDSREGQLAFLCDLLMAAAEKSAAVCDLINYHAFMHEKSDFGVEWRYFETEAHNV